MTGGNGQPTYDKEAAFFSGLGAGALLCAIWSGLFTVLNPWGDLGPTIVAVLAAAVAAAATAYRIGSPPFRIGIIAMGSLVGTLVLTVLLALAMAPLEPVYLTVLDERPLFYGTGVFFGSLMGMLFGKPSE